MKAHKTGGENSIAAAEGASILWRETESVCRLMERPLSEFLAGIEIADTDLATLQKSEPLLVFLRQACMKAMQFHTGQDIRREQAGILCGQAYLDPSGRHYIEVTSALPVNTLNTSSYFCFHKKSWEAIWDQIGAEKNILGWYHSHPGMGIFLSATDRRTQELYFAAPWQIAVVLDPVSREIGVFQRSDKINFVVISD